MLKLIYLPIALLFLFSCHSNEKVSAQNNSSSINKEIFIDFEPNPNIIRINDKDILKTIKIVYRPESDSIANLSEIEPNKIVLDVLDKPFNNLQLRIISDSAVNRVFNGIQELLKIFDTDLPNYIIEKINSIDSYNQIIKIAIHNADLYIYRESKSFFKLFIAEYNSNFLYEPIIKIGDSKNDILKLLGNPSGYSDERNLFIYQSFGTGRQIVIFFDNETVKSVQLASCG